MLPIKLIRSMVPHLSIAEGVAQGLSSIKDVTYDDINSETEMTCASSFRLPKLVSNDTVALQYLDGYSRRREIEREAWRAKTWTYEENLKDQYPLGERWVEDEWSRYWSWKNRRTRQRHVTR